MNNGKICVSVCTETADEFINKIKRAAEIADVIELRFDCLCNWAEIGKIRVFLIKNKSSIKQKILATLRNKDQGGNNSWITPSDELSFWGELLNHKMFDLEDLDFNLEYEKTYRNITKRIRSYHNFTNSSLNLEQVYKSISDENSTIIKIAIQANDITDSLAVWKLLKKANSENKQMIPIAMGEPGKWTRILGLAHGSPLTYASLESGYETAPGQISAKDLTEVYRVKELDQQTEIYGIIGNPVSHSLSPFMHNTAFKYHKLNAVYIPFEVADLDEFIKRMVREETREINWNLKGFSVTIPHKEAIIKHLDQIDEDAKAIGAVNTVHIVDGKLYGYNTDADGFIEPLRNSYGDLKSADVGIIGNGGAARACIYALKKEGANVTIFARNPEKANPLSEEFEVQCLELRVGENDFKDLDILINSSPLGMAGKTESETPASAGQIKNLHMVYDLVYTPFETLFLKEAKSVDVPAIGGLAMLVAQGMKQFENWTGKDAPMKEMSRAALQRLK